MPRGQPDYGLYTETPVASGISDPGEAAARLGSINIYDRRGWTVWMDDFEAPSLKWATHTALGGSTPVLSTTQAWMGAQSVYLAVPAVANAISRIYKEFPLLRLGRAGVEFFTGLNSYTPGYLQLYIILWDGSNLSHAFLRLDSRARTATIWTPAGFIEVATFCFPIGLLTAFTPVKLVVDVDTDYYVRLMIGELEIDLSAHRLIPGGATTVKLLEVHIEMVGCDIVPQDSYIDNFILTQNEP